MKVIALLIVGLLISPLAFCDNFFEDITDTLKGRNEDLPLTLYVAKTIELEKVPFVSILNADLRVKVSSSYGEEFLEKGMLEIGLEF